MEKIETAYTFASRKLLDMLMDEEQLLARLKSIKHYFLLDQGDFINHFMDIAEDELAKNVNDISEQKLKSLLELALRTSIANHDPFKDDLKCDLEPYTLVKHIMGIVGVSESKPGDLGKGTPAAASPSTRAASQTYANLVGLDLFTLSYQIKWPLSLVVSKKVLVKYQLIFRHLFHCKHVERQLCKTWQNHQSTKAFALRRSFVQSYALQQQMLHFLQNIQVSSCTNRSSMPRRKWAVPCHAVPCRQDSEWSVSAALHDERSAGTKMALHGAEDSQGEHAEPATCLSAVLSM